MISGQILSLKDYDFGVGNVLVKGWACCLGGLVRFANGGHIREAKRVGLKECALLRRNQRWRWIEGFGQFRKSRS